MAAQAQLYIWRKQASRTWLDEHEPQLLDRSYAVIERPQQKRLTLESVTSRSDAYELQQQYGGTIHRLPHNWQQQLFAASRIKPLRIGQRLTVTTDGRADAHTLVIPAGAAFGTGDHATTAMSLRMLERVTRQLATGWRMLDAGTGSGILALAAARFGAAEVLAIDNDPLAISTARANARLNRLRRVEFIVDDVKKKTPGKFHVITANLYSDLLEAVLPRFRRSLAAGGTLILSGVMRQQERQLTTALGASHFAVLEARRRGKWVALRCAHSRREKRS